MSEFNRPENTYVQSGMTLNQYMTKVFTIMGMGVALTAVVAFFGYGSLVSGGIMAQIFGNAPYLALVMLFIELGIAFAMGRGLTKYSTTTMYIMFFVYSAITGFTFSVLPMAYGLSTFGTAFLFAAVLFISCAIIGNTTSVDMTKFTSLLFGALISLVIVTVLGFFIPAIGNSLFVGYLGLVIFLGLTAYDMQRIKQFYLVQDQTIQGNLAVYAAFQLYLDFINILIYVLRILGHSNSSRN